jgi:hypothetical protein
MLPGALLTWPHEDELLAGDRVTIERRAKAQLGEIHWGDERALVNTDVRGRSYAPRGKTPVSMAMCGTCGACPEFCV